MPEAAPLGAEERHQPLQVASGDGLGDSLGRPGPDQYLAEAAGARVVRFQPFQKAVHHGHVVVAGARTEGPDGRLPIQEVILPKVTRRLAAVLAKETYETPEVPALCVARARGEAAMKGVGEIRPIELIPGFFSSHRHRFISPRTGIRKGLGAGALTKVQPDFTVALVTRTSRCAGFYSLRGENATFRASLDARRLAEF